jgi:phosphoribosylaminoimidazole-succinocarboxamide synthase
LLLEEDYLVLEQEICFKEELKHVPDWFYTYEFETKEGVIVLIDEITPDSSRYFTPKDTRNVKTAEKKTIIERVCSSLVNRKWFSRFGRATNSNMTDEYIETVLKDILNYMKIS